jgi:hypothetical protein
MSDGGTFAQFSLNWSHLKVEREEGHQGRKSRKEGGEENQ